MNFRLAQPEVVVDINRLRRPRLRPAADGGLAIGALTRQHAVERDPDGRARAADPRRGLPSHRPPAHPPPRDDRRQPRPRRSRLRAARRHGGARRRELVASSRRGRAHRRRRRSSSSGPLTTALQPDELLAEIRVPGLPPRTGGAFVEMARRAGDYALVGVAALITLDQSGRCERARLALCGVGPTPMRARAAEQALVGERPGGARARRGRAPRRGGDRARRRTSTARPASGGSSPATSRARPSRWRRGRAGGA